MNKWLDKAAGWAKGQFDEFGRAYGEMDGRRLAAADEMRSAAFNALPEPLKTWAMLGAAPKLRGPVQPKPVPPAPPKGRPPGGKLTHYHEVYRNNERIDPYPLFVQGEASPGYRK